VVVTLTGPATRLSPAETLKLVSTVALQSSKKRWSKYDSAGSTNEDERQGGFQGCSHSVNLPRGWSKQLQECLALGDGDVPSSTHDTSRPCEEGVLESIRAATAEKERRRKTSMRDTPIEVKQKGLLTGCLVEKHGLRLGQVLGREVNL
jgi:hypothetical protein